MARKGKSTLDTILREEEENSPAVTDVSIGELRPLPATNAELKEKYEEMHAEGPTAWFDDGAEERETILKMGEPWNMTVLEVGCGECDLAVMIEKRGSPVLALDYSETAINIARERNPSIQSYVENYRDHQTRHERLVLQGVLEHLDSPFVELKWMMDNLLVDGGDVITSSPMFVNPRGFVWMALNAIGAVMSKTDLHFLNPWDFEAFAAEEGYKLKWTSCNHSWANGVRMIEDFRRRLPLALQDGKLPVDLGKLEDLYIWLSKAGPKIDLGPNLGATAVYKITKG